MVNRRGPSYWKDQALEIKLCLLSLSGRTKLCRHSENVVFSKMFSRILLNEYCVVLYYCAAPAYLIALCCAGGVTSPPCTDCYPTAPLLLCGWSDGLEWSPGCAASDASDPLCSIPLWP